MSEQVRSTSVLNAISYIPSDDLEYINVAKSSDDELGKMLAPGYGYTFNTVFGSIGNVRNGMELITTPNYPMYLISKKQLTRKDIESIPSKKINLPNYWAIVAYLLCSRVQADTDLIEAIAKNELEYTSVYIKSTSAMGITGAVVSPNLKMGRYLGIIRGISKMIKNNTFEDSDILNFVNLCKDQNNKPLFDGLPFKMDISIEI